MSNVEQPKATPLWPSHGSPSAKSGSVTLLQPLCPFVQCWDEDLLALDAQHWDKISYICSSLNGVVQYPLHTMTQVRLQLQVLYAFFASPPRAWSDSPSGHVAALKILDTGKLLMFLHNLMQFVSAWKTVCSFTVSVWKTTELPSVLLICHENLFPNSYSPMT